MADLITCDCCGKRSRERHTRYVGKNRVHWEVCADCANNVVPRIPRTTEVPLLSVQFGIFTRRD